jgi:hypothetical protein
MVRRGSTVRVRQRASGFLPLRAVLVGCAGDGLLVKCPRDVHAVDAGLVSARVSVEKVDRVVASVAGKGRSIIVKLAPM